MVDAAAVTALSRAGDGTVDVGRRVFGVADDDDVAVSTWEGGVAGALSTLAGALMARRTVAATLLAGLDTLAALSEPAAALCDTTGLRDLGVVLSLDADDLEADDAEPEPEASADATAVPTAMPKPSATTTAPIRPTCAAAVIVGLIKMRPLSSDSKRSVAGVEPPQRDMRVE